MAARVISPLIAGLAGVMIAVYSFEPALKEDAIEKAHGSDAANAFSAAHADEKPQSESPILSRTNPSVVQLMAEDAKKGLEKKA